MSVNGIGQSYYQNSVATAKSAKNVNSTEEFTLEKTSGTQELSEAEEMELFKKDFYEDLSKVTNHRTVSNAAVNISEAAFKAMKDDPQYREKVLSLIQRDWGDSYAPRNCSVLITVGATLNEYRADSWPVGYDSEFNVRSHNSFYKRTSEKKDRQKELLEEYLEKRARMKEFQQEALDEKIAKAESKAAAEAKTSSKDKVEAYYEQLCKKFPQINFNTNGGVLPSNSSKVTVNLSYDCLKRMANDPEFAKEIEWNLSGEVVANSMVYGWAQRDGVVLGGRTVTYDANGNRQSSCGGMRTANAGNGNNNINKTQKKYKEEEERWLNARKKREQKGKFDEKIAERRVERKAQMEKVMQEHTEKSAIRKEQLEKGNAVQIPVEFSTGMNISASTGFDIKA